MKTFTQILVVGLFPILAFSKLNAQTAELDSTYGENGKFISLPDTVSYSFNAFAIQDDEKLVAGGRRFPGALPGYDAYVVRFKADGGYDSTFGNNGYSDFLPLAGNNETVNCIAVQPDGKIVLAGGYSSPGNNDVFVCRFNANGTIDSTFDDDGYRILPLTVGSDETARAIAVQPDGKLIICGNIAMASQVPFFIRLDDDGSLDGTFGTGGIALFEDTGFGIVPYSVKLQEDGKIVGLVVRMGGTSPTSLGVIRLTSSGAKDLTFGSSGIAVATFDKPAFPGDFCIQSDGKILIGGTQQTVLPSGSKNDIVLARFMPSGVLDNTFGTLGKSVSVVAASAGLFVQPIVQPTDGKILVVTCYKPTSSAKYRSYIARFLPNGSTDLEWGGAGYISEEFFPGKDNYQTKIHYTSSGKIFVAGIASDFYVEYLTLARYKSCGMSILSHPSDIVGAEGATISLSVTGSSPSAVYQWQRQAAGIWVNLINGGQYSGVSTNSLSINNLTLANDGELYRAVGLAGACTDTSDIALLNVTPSTSLDDLLHKAGIEVYPNPVEDKVMIRLSEAAEPLETVTLRDIFGRQISTIQIDNKKEIEIEVTHLEPGIYFVHMRTRKGATYSHKLSKI